MIIVYNRNSGYKNTKLNLRAYNTMHAIHRLLIMSLCLFFVEEVKGFCYTEEPREKKTETFLLLHNLICTSDNRS